MLAFKTVTLKVFLQVAVPKELAEVAAIWKMVDCLKEPRAKGSLMRDRLMVWVE